MCGRYVSSERAAIECAWHIGRSTSNPFKQRYNVAPTTLVPILRSGPDGDLELLEARWGLVPSWWKDELLKLRGAVLHLADGSFGIGSAPGKAREPHR